MSSSNEQGPLWTPTVVVERLLRQTGLSTAEQITMDRKQLEGLLFDVLRCRNNHSVGAAHETPAVQPDLIKAAEMFHDIYCPVCPDDQCNLGRLLRGVQKTSVPTEEKSNG